METKMKLQPGDYVSTEGMTEEQYHAVCKAFMDAGAGKGDYGFYTFDRVATIIFDSKRGRNQLWCSSMRSDNINCEEGILLRELTIDQILGEPEMDLQHEKDMSLTQAYQIMQDNCGIEVGDTVKVLRGAESRENGWPDHWDKEMDESIGGTFTVTDVNEWGIHANDFYYPFFVLELIKKASKLPEPIEISSQYKCKFKEDGSISVGYQTLDFDLIEKIYLTAKEIKGE